MKIKHIFFDLDHTLWDFEKNSKISLEELFQEYLIDFGINFKIFYEVYKKINNDLWEKYREGKISKNFLRDSRFEKVLNFFSIYDKSLSFKLANFYVKNTPKKKYVFPNCHSVLDNLYEKYNLHIITNGFKEVQYTKLKNSNLMKYFDKIITSESAGYLKPDRRIFDYALNLLGIDVKECIMIGDNPHIDCLSAESIGIRSILFTPSKIKFNDYNESEIRKIKYKISDLNELLKIL